MRTFGAFLHAFLLFLAFGAQSAIASVVIEGTRVIYNENDREVNVRITNKGSAASLVQVWVDGGRADIAADEADVPFLVTPPLVRMEAGKSQLVRIIYTSADLPEDKESLFWLNVLDIPALSKSLQSENTIQLAVRSRLKLFFRPTGIDNQPKDLPKSLVWDNFNGMIRVSNRSDYHVSLKDVRFNIRGRTIDLTDYAMITPRSNFEFKLTNEEVGGAGLVEFGYINDYGGVSNHSAYVD